MGTIVRRGRRAAAGLLVLLAIAVAACTSDPEVAIDGEPAEAVAAAARQASGTVRFRVDVRRNLDVFVSVQVAEGIAEADGDWHATISTTMEVADAEGQGEDAPSLPPGLQELAGTREVIVLDGVVYTRWEGDGGPPGRPELPPGMEWVAADAEGAVDTSGYLQARRILDTLGAVTEVVEDRGTTTVEGEPVRWLRVEAPGDDDGEAEVIPPGTIIDVALDEEGLVRRVGFRTSEGGLVTRVIVDYEAYGVDDVVEPPPADATVDRADLDASPTPAP